MQERLLRIGPVGTGVARVVLALVSWLVRATKKAGDRNGFSGPMLHKCSS